MKKMQISYYAKAGKWENAILVHARTDKLFILSVTHCDNLHQCNKHVYRKESDSIQKKKMEVSVLFCFYFTMFLKITTKHWNILIFSYTHQEK